MDHESNVCPWSRAESFRDLLLAARRFVVGEIEAFPGWGAGTLDEESDALQDVLLAANAAGLLTVASQPGRPFAPGHDGWAWGGRAFLGGFAEPGTGERLASAAAELGLVALTESVAGREEPFACPVGLRDGTPYLVLGSGARAEELEIFENEIGRNAYAALAASSLVWIVDPVWGRRSRLGRLVHSLRV